MKKIVWSLLIGCLLVFLSACGETTKEDATSDLVDKVEKVHAYKANAKMVFETGETPQEYEVEVWYSQPHYYRVHLKHAEEKQSQMIIRNDEGVFVLTPALNKSFRFQSDWPANGSQAYLIESLVKDIAEDDAATFAEKDGKYVFATKTRYKHQHMFPMQEVIFDKKTLSPTSVKVKDQEGNVKISLTFTKVDTEAKFEKSDFNLEKNMMGAQLEVPVLGDGSETEEAFVILYPTEELEGTTLHEEQEVEIEGGKRVIMTFSGEKNYTLIQEKLEAAPVMLTTTEAAGEIVDLGFAVGSITEQSVSWSFNGVDYMLASTDLTPEEMVTVARSVQGTVIK
ncbi:LolA family protein [Jeotgalibacillus soli]|uniref:Sporulation protein n=1 Tax=Jeotgalibacillus soli TaxID=889306 RepID=A0A0C2W842_9BACL|nr:outer membrane lipoprotein carrier protein LolA [Jeotgalibacillus soli]KIL52203.1 sporulation protein [Jeotgalibacillus soli]